MGNIELGNDTILKLADSSLAMLADCGGVLMSELDGHVREGTYGVVIGDFVKGYFLTELLGALMRR